MEETIRATKKCFTCGEQESFKKCSNEHEICRDCFEGILFYHQILLDQA